jgi:iron-sulfur cluster assembly protein
MEPIVILTDKAIESVKRFRGDQGGVLRLGIKGGGCSGFQYALALDHPQDEDIIYEQGDVQIAVSLDAVSLLKGSTLDFKETVEEAGFVFENPNATGGCGCGSSFRVDEQQGCDSSTGESPV